MFTGIDIMNNPRAEVLVRKRGDDTPPLSFRAIVTRARDIQDDGTIIPQTKMRVDIDADVAVGDVIGYDGKEWGIHSPYDDPHTSSKAFVMRDRDDEETEPSFM